MKLLFVIVGIAVFVIVGLLLLVYLSPSGDSELVKKKSKRKRTKSIFDFMFDFYRHVPWISSVQNGFHKLHEGSGEHPDNFKRKSGKATFMVLLGPLLFLVFGALFSSTIVIFLIYIMAAVVTFKIGVNRTQVTIFRNDLYHLQELVGKLKSGYSETKTVSGSLEQSSLTMGLKHSVTAARILEILSGERHMIEVELEHYYRKVPNKYLKQLAALSHKVTEVGDVEEGRFGSLFQSGLHNLLEDIRREYNYLQRLRQRLEGSSTNLVIAYIFVQACIWATPLFNITHSSTDFLSSPIGLLATIVTFLGLAVLSADYLAITTLHLESDVVRTEKLFLSKLMEKKFFRELIHRLAPVHKQTKRSVDIVERTEPLLKRASSTLTVQEFYLQKIMYFAVVFITVFALLQAYHVVNKKYLLGANWTKIAADTKDGFKERSKKEFDYNMIKYADEHHLTEAEVLALVSEQVQYKPFLDDTTAEEYSKKFTKKYESYSHSYTKWYDFPISAGVALGGWYLPQLMLGRRAKNREWEIQNEVEGFYTIIMIMSRMASTQVLEILTWMERYAIIFKQELSEAVQGYIESPHKALQELDLRVRNATMSDILRRLEKSISDVDLRDAFGDLESNREFMRENREIQQEGLLASKSYAIKKVGDRATFWVLLLLLLLPIGVQIMPMLGPLKEVFNGGLEK